MRSADMCVGELYAVGGSRSYPIKVRVLETPPEVTSKARVRIRYESGVVKGKVCDVPSRRIYARWEERFAKPTPSGKLEETRTSGREIASHARGPEAVAVDRPLAVGGQVVLAQASVPLVWKVREFHEPVVAGGAREATVVTTIFGRPQEKRISLDQVLPTEAAPQELPEGSLRPLKADLPFTRGNHPQPLRDIACDIAHLEPERPVRELDELMENVVFTPKCLGFYQRRYAPDVPWARVNDVLRNEVRRKGFLDRAHSTDGFGRIRVLRRFDIVLEHRLTATEPCSINGLIPAASGKRRKAGNRRGRQPGRRAA